MTSEAPQYAHDAWDHYLVLRQRWFDATATLNREPSRARKAELRELRDSRKREALAARRVAMRLYKSTK